MRILLVFMFLGTLFGCDDYHLAVQEHNIYCENVALYVWPDYEQSFDRACGEEYHLMREKVKCATVEGVAYETQPKGCSHHINSIPYPS